LWLEKIIKNNSLDKNNYSTIFLNIDIEILKERIQIRWDKISEKQLKNRVESSYNEIKIAEKICDYILDASKTQVDVLQEFLNIIKK
jgi:thymidylate kinase